MNVCATTLYTTSEDTKIIDIRIFPIKYRKDGSFTSNTENIINFILQDVDHGYKVELTIDKWGEEYC